MPSSPGAPNNISADWFPRSFSRPALFYAIIYACRLHEFVLTGASNRKCYLEVQVSFTEAIGALAKDMKDMSRFSLDETILVIFLLAYLSLNEEAVSRTLSISQGPLGDLQWLQVWGRYRLDPMHAPALAWLIGMRGGLDCIEMKGLAEFISLYVVCF